MSAIKNLPLVERPREKLLRYGAQKLSNAELLAVIVRTGMRDKNAIQLARELLRKFSGQKLTHANVAEICSFCGIGPVKAAQIVACFELGKRLLKNKKAFLCLRAKDVWQQLYDIRARRKEYVVVFYLDARSQEVQRDVISIGTLTESMIHPREIFENAILHNAAQILVAHNHPSGNAEPSAEDIRITTRLVSAGKILGIDVIDHVIVTTKTFVSFRSRGLL